MIKNEIVRKREEAEVEAEVTRLRIYTIKRSVQIAIESWISGGQINIQGDLAEEGHIVEAFTPTVRVKVHRRDIEVIIITEILIATVAKVEKILVHIHLGLNLEKNAKIEMIYN